MGNNTSTRSPRENGSTNKFPSDRLLGQMLRYWLDKKMTKGKEKQQMIKHCCFIWNEGPILKSAVFWSRFGSDEDWVCQLLIESVNDKYPRSQKEIENAVCWRWETVVLFPLISRKNDKMKNITEQKEKPSKRDPLSCLALL
jgi:hypothetical protein